MRKRQLWPRPQDFDKTLLFFFNLGYTASSMCPCLGTLDLYFGGM